MRRNIISALLISASLSPAIGCDTGGYAIGDTGPAGGLVFYVDEADAHDWTYLEVAPPSTEWTSTEWGANGTGIGGDALLTGIGDGQAATNAIVQHLADNTSETDTAAQLCDALSEGGYDDWYLPSKDELSAIWANLVDDSDVGGFARESYWSSSEIDSGFAWEQSLGDGYQNGATKNYGFRVRAVRAF